MVGMKKFGPWAIVTGASSGIGKEFANQLASSGLNFVLVARRLSLLEKLGDRLGQQFGIEYRTIQADLSDENFMKGIEQATNDLDIGLVISNAGAGAPGEFLDAELNRSRMPASYV
jgi:short-subunit dehydrogenase